MCYRYIIFIILWLFTIQCNAMHSSSQEENYIQDEYQEKIDAHVNTLRNFIDNSLPSTTDITLKFNPYSKYIEIYSSFFKARRNDKSLKKYHELKIMYEYTKAVNEQKILTKDLENIKNKLVKKYKIHLMPKENDLIPTIAKIINKLVFDKNWQKVLFFMKFRPILETIDKNQHTILPIVVLYPGSQKEHAQYVLDAVYTLFKDQEGINQTPRFNAKITSLIYYAQGDGDDKERYYLNKYYERPDKIFYLPNFTFEVESYHLINPAQKEIKKD